MHKRNVSVSKHFQNDCIKTETDVIFETQTLIAVLIGCFVLLPPKMVTVFGKFTDDYALFANCESVSWNVHIRSTDKMWLWWIFIRNFANTFTHSPFCGIVSSHFVHDFRYDIECTPWWEMTWFNQPKTSINTNTHTHTYLCMHPRKFSAWKSLTLQR